MMSPDPTLRPTVSDIFKLQWFSSIVQPDGSENSTANLLELMSQLSQAKEQISQLEMENLLLKARLLELDPSK
jgi:hypothetical protein